MGAAISSEEVQPVQQQPTQQGKPQQPVQQQLVQQGKPQQPPLNVQQMKETLPFVSKEEINKMFAEQQAIKAQNQTIQTQLKQLQSTAQQITGQKVKEDIIKIIDERFQKLAASSSVLSAQDLVKLKNEMLLEIKKASQPLTLSPAEKEQMLKTMNDLISRRLQVLDRVQFALPNKQFLQTSSDDICIVDPKKMVEKRECDKANKCVSKRVPSQMCLSDMMKQADEIQKLKPMIQSSATNMMAMVHSQMSAIQESIARLDKLNKLRPIYPIYQAVSFVQDNEKAFWMKVDPSKVHDFVQPQPGIEVHTIFYPMNRPPQPYVSMQDFTHLINQNYKLIGNQRMLRMVKSVASLQGISLMCVMNGCNPKGMVYVGMSSRASYLLDANLNEVPADMYKRLNYTKPVATFLQYLVGTTDLKGRYVALANQNKLIEVTSRLPNKSDVVNMMFINKEEVKAKVASGKPEIKETVTRQNEASYTTLKFNNVNFVGLITQTSKPETFVFQDNSLRAVVNGQVDLSQTYAIVK